jgi:hypothetical protein
MLKVLKRKLFHKLMTLLNPSKEFYTKKNKILFDQLNDFCFTCKNGNT